MSAKELLAGEIERIVTGRLLWAVIPARHALLLRGNGRLADMVTWALSNLSDDIEATLERYEIEKARSAR